MTTTASAISGGGYFSIRINDEPIPPTLSLIRSAVGVESLSAPPMMQIELNDATGILRDKYAIVDGTPGQRTGNPNDSSSGNNQFIKMGDKFINIENLNIDLIDAVNPFHGAYEILSKSVVTIEIPDNNQYNITTRPIESLGTKTKVLTRNSSIKLYDFYNESNFFIFDDKNIKDINDWLKVPFSDYSKEILNKYHINQWIEKILN